MTSLKVALACALVLPLSSLACGGTEGEPDVADGSSKGVTPPAMSKGDGSASADGARKDAGHADAGAEAATSTLPDAAATDARPDGAAMDGKVEAAPPRDHGEASTVYPAFPPFVPQVQYGDGPVLSSGEIVTITWSGDTNASMFEDFGDDIGQGDYWRQTTSEYKVGPAHSGPVDHVRLPVSEAPIASWADTDLAAWVQDHASNAAMYGWPAPTGNTVYVLYTSSATDVTTAGTSDCQQGIGGYHGNVIVNGQDVAYAVVLQCQGGQGNITTAFASHELIEAATDPHPQDITGWMGFDGAHLAWDVFQSFQDEVGDACEFYRDAFFDSPFPVMQRPSVGADAGEGGVASFDAGSTSFAAQRTWSNVSASQGHSPCVPSDYSVYFNVTPLQLDPAVTINLSSQGGPASLQGQGYKIASGATRTFPIGFWSDGPTTGPWTISAVEGNPLTGGPASSHLTISVDKPSGQNGDIAYVTVKVNSVDTTMNGELVTIESQLTGFHRTFMPILISNE